MPYVQKYVIVHFLQTTPDGAHFAAKDWPLHITLASNFQIARQEVNLLEKLATFAKNHTSVATTAADDAHFGPNQEVLVTTFNVPPQLQKLHEDLIKLLKENNAIFDTPEYLESGFRPHATVQQNARANRGNTVIISDFALVDMFPNSDANYRRIMQTFSLRNKFVEETAQAVEEYRSGINVSPAFTDTADMDNFLSRL